MIMMKKVVEKQLSCFTLLLAAFYSLLATSHGEECGHEHLTRCARPLGKINHEDGLGFVTTKKELEDLCPDLQAGMTCIKKYTQRCMPESQREHFNRLYKGVNMGIIELCQEGSYQDAFLKHAPCMQTVQSEYELCSKKYQNSVRELDKQNLTISSEPVKAVCCAFQEFLDCSHHTVRRKCGEETAVFTKNFLDMMANSLIKTHCTRYKHAECLYSGASTIGASVISLIMVLLLSLRYLFT